jgi:hypothetical protein
VVRYLFLGLVDLLLIGVRRAFAWAMSGKAAVLRLWADTGARELLFVPLDFLLAVFRALELHLDRVRTRMRYRVFFEEFTTPLAERCRRLRRS